MPVLLQTLCLPAPTPRTWASLYGSTRWRRKWWGSRLTCCRRRARRCRPALGYQAAALRRVRKVRPRNHDHTCTADAMQPISSHSHLTPSMTHVYLLYVCVCAPPTLPQVCPLAKAGCPCRRRCSPITRTARGRTCSWGQPKLLLPVARCERLLASPALHMLDRARCDANLFMVLRPECADACCILPCRR